MYSYIFLSYGFGLLINLGLFYFSCIYFIDISIYIDYVRRMYHNRDFQLMDTWDNETEVKFRFRDFSYNIYLLRCASIDATGERLSDIEWTLENFVTWTQQSSLTDVSFGYPKRGATTLKQNYLGRQAKNVTSLFTAISKSYSDCFLCLLQRRKVKPPLTEITKQFWTYFTAG